MSGVPPGRRRTGKTGWTVVGGGWSILVPAVVLVLLQTGGSPLPGLLAALGAICVLIGSLLLSRGRAIWMIFIGMAATFLWGIGLVTAADEKQVAAQGRQMTCEVRAIRPETRTRTTTDGGGRRSTSTSTVYWHTMACPTGTYDVSSGGPDPVGARLGMVQVPGEKPRFAGSGLGVVSPVMASLGGLLTVALPLIGWRYGRRRAEAVRQPAQPYPSGASAPPYERW